MSTIVKPRVASLLWGSIDGWIFYREIYDDGSSATTPTFIGMETDDPRYRVRKVELENQLIGKVR